MAERTNQSKYIVLLFGLIASSFINGLDINVREDATVGSTLPSSFPAPGSGFVYSVFGDGDHLASSLFGVSPSGKITVRKKLTYVNGGRNKYELIAVKRKDGTTIGGKAEVARISVIDVNDHVPVFKKSDYQGHIYEGSAAGSVVRGLEDCFATDQDSSGVAKYLITSGNDANLFAAKVKDISGLKLLQIVTIRSLDREALGNTPISLQVQAVDGGNPEKKSAIATIRIKVLDRNDNGPVFNETNWRATIQENSPVMTSVVKVKASDNDEGSNKQLYYYFPTEQDDFVIDPYTGVIYVAAPLSYNKKNSYNIKVSVTDRAVQDPKTSTSEVHISLVQVSNYPPASVTNTAPQFATSLYEIKVRGDLPLKAFVLLPRATDSDGIGNSNGRLTFSLSPVSTTNPFTVNPRSGAITVNKKLPATPTTVEFTVTAQDGGALKADTTVRIEIRAINQNKGPPEFKESTVNVDFVGDADKPVFTAVAVDSDNTAYSIVEGTGLGRFQINENTGVIKSKGAFKSLATYDLYIEAKDKNVFPMSSTMYARVNIKSSNHSNPVFTKAMYTGKIDEGEMSGSFVTAVRAEFPDPTKVVKYKVTNTAIGVGLMLDPNTGIVTTDRILDYELDQKKSLEIQAYVEGSAATASTLVEVYIQNKNDEDPYFPRSNINMQVPENLGYIPNLVCLFAIDGDGSETLSYSIKQGNTGDVFKIDPKTGQLSVKNLDYETQSSYTLLVEATDGKKSTTATVKVSVVDDNLNPEPPHFGSYKDVVTIREGSTSTVQDLPVSGAASSFTCVFGYDVTPDILNKFMIRTQSSSCLVETTGNIKWTKAAPSYKFTIRVISKSNAMQSASAELTVKIQDINDHAPVLSQTSYAASLYMSAAVGTSVLKVSATDEDDGPNGAISYAFLASDDANSFNIDSVTGVVKIQKALQAGKEYKMTVRANDKGSTPKHTDAMVTFGVQADGTVMPNFDSLSDQQFALEGVSSGIVTSAKVTLAGANIEYNIVGGNKDNEFAIDNSGTIYVNSKVLDREKVPEYNLVVRAAKQGVTPILVVEKTVRISIKDVNDNEPEFNVRGSPEVTIQTNAPIGTVVSMFRAFDKDFGDNAKLSYVTEPAPGGDSSVPFNAGIHTGIITTTQVITTKRTYNIILRATDNGPTKKSKTLSIKVNMVDGSTLPSFQDTQYKISLKDNNKAGKRVGEVSVKDFALGDFIQYEIVSGNENNFFCIDYNRKVYLQKPLDLDTMTTQTTDMTVTLKFKNSVSSSQLFIYSTKENDNVPVFAGGSANVVKVIPEKEVPTKGLLVYQFKATDPDDPKTDNIEYSFKQFGNSASKAYFAIDSVNGKVTLKKRLDFETLDKHVITVMAKEQASTGYALKNLIVKVTDLNDEAPVFSVTGGRYYIPKDEKKGARVLQLHASDLDSGTNGEITYALANDKDEIFSIDPKTGVITLNKIIANYDRESFTITVMATDKGNPSLTGQAAATIEAVTKDGPPKFALSKFKFEYDEGQRMNGKTKAISVDTLTYSILSGNKNNKFKIDKARGFITSVTALDAEEGMEYTLLVQAKDTSERTATAEVHISVKNLNDNEPMFLNAKNGLIEKVVSKRAMAGETLVTVRGEDKDVGDLLTYEIIDKDQKQIFEIGAKNGQIKLKKNWADVGAKKNFAEFDVKASDRGTPPKTKTVRVRIVFAYFKPDHVKIVRSVPEDASVSASSVISDLPRVFPLGGYEIVYPKNHPFKISEKTGEITLKTALDFEVVEKYDLVIQENNYNLKEDTRYLNYRLEVKVKDVNDNPPKFDMKSFTGRVNKNARPGTEVIKLVAKDADSGDAGRISFDIITDNVPFTVNPVTHTIEVSKLAALTKNQYDLKIAAEDSGVPQRRSATQPVLTINVVNDPPHFTESLYKFKVSEKANVETLVGTVSAKSLSGIAVTYKIDSGNTNDKFRVDGQGRLFVQRPLDHETDPSSFTLVVSAEEIASNSLKSTTNVIVELINDNDNNPKFEKLVYRVADIAEDTPVNSLILTVKATDKDCGDETKCMPGSLIYSTDQFKDTFRLDSLTGEIRNIKTLDYDTKKKYEFEVKVEDFGLIKRTAKAKVIITLKGVNDNPPVFSPNHQKLYIAEKLPAGTKITVVRATDVDNDPLTYSIKEGDIRSFQIDSKSGLVTLKTSRLRGWSFHLKISASDGKHEGFFNLLINVDDNNNNPPVFTKCSSYSPVVAENKDAGTLVLKVTASDDDFDRSGQIEYTLLQVGGKTDGSGKQTAVGGTGSSQTLDFNIDKDGNIRTNGRFDREAQGTYTLIAIARDGGENRTDFERNSAACELNIKVLDENDNKPIFAIENYEVSVWQGTSVGAVILVTSALDQDEGPNAQIEYSIVEDSSLFSIPDKTKGEIQVKASLSGKLGEYNLRVKAANPGTIQASTVNVKITVGNSKPPKFSSTIYRTSIVESLQAGAVIPSLAVSATSQNSAKSNVIVYNLPKGSLVQSNLDTFAIDSRNGQIKVAGELNYETTKNYIVYVQAKDETNNMVSNAIVYIDILDVNDNSPIFHLSKFEFQTINEADAPGATIGQIYASDKDSTTNAELVYFIEKDEQKKDFAIDSKTGILTTKRTFDREQKETVTIHVYAKDMGTNSLSNNVYVTIKIVDLNDNAPVLEPSVYNGNVKEDAKTGYQILTITAKDADAGDNAKVNFFITGGNEDGYFSTSRSTFKAGISTASILVAKPLDRERKDTFKLTITASDSKFSVNGVVNIKVTDANDNAPVFLKDFYLGSIKEDVKAGVSVTKVEARDDDTAAVQGPIRYSLSKEVQGIFVIDPVTGVISTGPKPFDRETKQVYRFTVFASDGKHQGTAIVECTIKDVNDKKPYFPGAPYIRYIEENKPAGTVVGYVPAKDDDDPNEGGNAKIKYSIVGNDQGFVIDSATGLVKTKKSFDREATGVSPVFKVTVRATDSGIPVQANETIVTIIVTDANDNDPKFTKSLFVGKVAECAPGGTKITTVTAVDKDDITTVNAQLLYYVISSSHNSEKYFHVNGQTGVVTVAHGLDYERSGKYQLKVGVKDRGIPQRPMGREESTMVEITVTDCNDNRPVFIPDSYKVSVKENVKVGETLLTVTAVDKDKGSNGDFTFGIVDTELNFQFGISSSAQNRSKGVIKLAYPVDREAVSKHLFKVSASDMGLPKQTGYAAVEITLIDVNDNGPHFDKPEYCGRVEEEQNPASVQVVTKIKVSDPDTTKYSCPCKFKFKSGDTSLFEMRNADGNSVEIVTKPVRFDREKKRLYTLYIEASDGGSPPMTNVTTLKVEVHDKNDNVPSSGGELSLLVNSYQGKFIGGVVGKVYVKDDDKGSHDLYEHTLTSQSPGKFFSVNKKTGEIIAAANVPDGKYKLAFRSKELNRQVGSDRGKEVVSTVTVTVRAISEKQAKTSVAIRMQGLVKPGSCNDIPYPEFESILAKILGVPVELVTVFSAQSVKGMYNGVDIRFAVKKSAKAGYAGDDAEYVDKSTLVPILNAKIAEIEKATNGKVDSVGIDPCALETCQVGFCYNDIQPQRTYKVITDDNGIVPANPASKTFISIDVNVVATCQTGPRVPKSCKDKPCLYGGKCTDLVTGGFSCACTKPSLDGPRCEMTIKSFKTKQSYLWVKSLNYFFEGTLQFEFGTKDSSGLILYQGPVHKISNRETKDYLAIELIDGRLRISANQGDFYRNFVKLINTKNKLNDGVFHSVKIYKKGKYIKVTVDDCRDAEIVETETSTKQDRSSCEITGVIPGRFRFINGLNPLQLGGMKNKGLAYPPLTAKDSFAGCIRKVSDNGIIYDLSKTIEERDVGNDCSLLAKCPKCFFGYCRATQLPFICICHFGWTGPNCDRRVKSYHYKKDSYSQYTFIKPTALAWHDRYRSMYEVQMQTNMDGILVYEGSPTSNGNPREFSILEVYRRKLRYRFNLGDGEEILTIGEFNASDNKWHNVTVDRKGNYAVVTMHGVGQVAGTKGTHQLLDSDGVIYTGGVPTRFNIRPPFDLRGCLADFRVRYTNMDSDTAVARKRVNVEPNGCPCVGIVCLNGGICVAGSPPYCICPPGFKGLYCGESVVKPEAGALAVVSKDGYLVMAVLLVVFLLVLVLAALMLASKFAGKKAVPVYVDDDPRDNIMPYHDEGAGEDDFHNYDLEKLLKHAGAARSAGLANGSAGGGGAKDIEQEPLLTREDVDFVAAGAVSMRQKKTRFEGANVESVDVARFITSRLEEANGEDAAYPRDTLLHYGYEGEGSDVDDLSELGDSEDESDDDDADFGFLGEWGTKFDNLNKIFNPPTQEFDEDV